MFLKTYYTLMKMFIYIGNLSALETQQYNAHFLKIVSLVKSEFSKLKIDQQFSFH